jgi:hypothetical protein
VDERKRVPILSATDVVTVSIGGREVPWLSKIVGTVLRPFLRRGAEKRQRLLHPHFDRIRREVESELEGGRSNPEFHARFADRISAWLKEHPEFNQ